MEAAGECFIQTSQIKVSARSRKVWKSVVKEWARGIISITLPEAFCLAWTPCLSRSGASRDCHVHQLQTCCYFVTILVPVCDWEAHDKDNRRFWTHYQCALSVFYPARSETFIHQFLSSPIRKDRPLSDSLIPPATCYSHATLFSSTFKEGQSHQFQQEAPL